MRPLILLFCFTLGGTLFAAGQTDSRPQTPEVFTVTGGIEEVDTSLDPGLLEFIKGITEQPGDSGAETEIIRLFRQFVRGFKFITCVKLADGTLAIFIIHKDISGEFSLMESYTDTEIFFYFYPNPAQTLALDNKGRSS